MSDDTVKTWQPADTSADGSNEPPSKAEEKDAAVSDKSSTAETSEAGAPREIGGRKGPEPTRYGDWEKNGRCIDF